MLSAYLSTKNRQTLYYFFILGLGCRSTYIYIYIYIGFYLYKILNNPKQYSFTIMLVIVYAPLL